MPAPLSRMLNDMVTKDASDLYLSAGSTPKFSLQGNFVDAAPGELSPEDTQAYAQEVLTPDQWQQFVLECEMNTAYVLGASGRFRVNVFRQRGNVALVMRRIKVQIPRLDELNLPNTLGNLIMEDRGLILVTGATGSGKSTTLAAMIDYRNERMGGHIITIEDPVEFTFRNKRSLISQREVGVDTRTFGEALRNTLRQAPKVIYIGEIRDTETMGFALHASETGHLVLATLHSNNANQAIDRIVHFFPHDFQEQLLIQLSMNLKAIISQRLVKKVGGGRVPALEVLINSPLIQELIAKNQISGLKNVMRNSANEGMQTFDMDLHRLFSTGMITEEEALRNADSANNLRLRMRGIA